MRKFLALAALSAVGTKTGASDVEVDELPSSPILVIFFDDLLSSIFVEFRFEKMFVCFVFGRKYPVKVDLGTAKSMFSLENDCVFLLFFNWSVAHVFAILVNGKAFNLSFFVAD